MGTEGRARVRPRSIISILETIDKISPQTRVKVSFWQKNLKPWAAAFAHRRPLSPEATDGFPFRFIYYLPYIVPDPWHFGVDPDPAIFVIDLRDANKKLI